MYANESFRILDLVLKLTNSLHFSIYLYLYLKHIHQYIGFQLTLPLDLKNGVSLNPKNLSFSAPMALTQFTLISQTFSSLENGRTVDVEFVLQRIISYHLTNTFIPTISLLVISEITLSFDETQTELAMSLSLTILLVM